MAILLLGGTRDGVALAQRLHSHGLEIIYSLAGLVRIPEMPCRVVSGGFSQYGGLVSFIQQESIQAIVDVTHPYAQQMSNTAVTAATTCNIPCWRLNRPQWQPQEGDRWHYYDHWDDLFYALESYRSVFLSCGQVQQQYLAILAKFAKQQQLLRTAVEPQYELPLSVQHVQAIGPFKLDDELALLKQYDIDVIVSKNSGGDGASAKLFAARQLGLPVLMLSRPRLRDAHWQSNDINEIEQFILANMKSVNK